ncbi:MAG: sialate O-acetylesterase [Verrucomicrobiota bacterium]
MPVPLKAVKANETAVLSADFSVPAGTIRPLHGINKGPLAPGGQVEVIREQKELGIPLTRLHDCGWPNPYVVDHHAVFPNPDADPGLPESYDFRLTDEYIDAVRRTGAEPVYRLGESIEHTAVKRFVHPPADPEKWAAVCLGIIRHYNEGWANGFHHGIRCWEIWNEPENRPAMWSGTDDDYLKLYRTAATAIKKEFPALKVGGPALGASGSFVKGAFVPTAFAENFLKMCRRNQVPLNFFSWHCYTADPAEFSTRARAIRRLLDSHGFTDTENHLNEWNYLPDNTWEPISRSAPAVSRQRFYEKMSGAPGAAFVAAALLELQDAPVDVCNFFHGELGGFGIFNEQGVPQKVYQALRAFQSLVETPRRVETHGAVPGKLAFAAGLSPDGREATLLVSHFADSGSDITLNWKGFAWTGGVTADIRLADAGNDFSTVRSGSVPGTGETGTLNLTLKAPALALIRLRPMDGPAAKTTLSVTSPANRLVFQRNEMGTAAISVNGACAWPGAAVEARTVDAATRQAGAWTALGMVRPDFKYSGKLTVPAGWYSLEVRARAGEKPASTASAATGDSISVSASGAIATASVTRFGVGEVFVVVGHSVAHGGDINLPGAEDDRISTIALPAGGMESQRQYRLTGDPRFLPEAAGRHFDSGVQPAPAGNGPYFWAAFAEHTARKQNVPVLVLNAAFGGTSLEHWAKSARGEPFEHPFVKSSIRMPYIRLEHALTKYCAVTGLRAILADQGQNDWPEKDEEKIIANYRTWIDQARRDADFPGLAVVVNRQSPPGSGGRIRRIQDRMILEFPHCFPGPDYETLAPEDTVDKVHLSESGAKKAAGLWTEALTAEFFKSAAPLPPK